MDFKGRLITTYIEPLMESGDFDTGKKSSISTNLLPTKSSC